MLDITLALRQSIYFGIIDIETDYFIPNFCVPKHEGETNIAHPDNTNFRRLFFEFLYKPCFHVITFAYIPINWGVILPQRVKKPMISAGTCSNFFYSNTLRKDSVGLNCSLIFHRYIR